MTETHGSGRLDQIRRIADPVKRAREAVAFTVDAESQAKEGRAIRDEALRIMKSAGISIPEISRSTGVNAATVKVVTR